MRLPIILIDAGHGKETPGKRSPEGLVREYAWARKIAKRLVKAFREAGQDSFEVTPEEQDISLEKRAERVNAYCNRYGKENVILLSVHLNASGNTLEWRKAHGWSAYTTEGVTGSDELAACLYEEAEECLAGKKLRKYKGDQEPDWEENFYILRKTLCVAVLTENFFQDNREDVEYILSEAGQEAIVQTHLRGVLKFIGKMK